MCLGVYLSMRLRCPSSLMENIGMDWKRRQPTEKMSGSPFLRMRGCHRCFFSRTFASQPTPRARDRRGEPSRTRTATCRSATHLQEPEGLLGRQQAANNDGVVRIKEVDELARHLGDDDPDVQTRSEAGNSARGASIRVWVSPHAYMERIAARRLRTPRSARAPPGRRPQTRRGSP